MGNSSSSSSLSATNQRYAVTPTKHNLLEGVSASREKATLKTIAISVGSPERITAEELLEFLDSHKGAISKILTDYTWKPRDSGAEPFWNVTDGAISTVSIGEGASVSLVECMAISKFYFDHGKGEFRYHGHFRNDYDKEQAEKMINALNGYVNTHFRR